MTKIRISELTAKNNVCPNIMCGRKKNNKLKGNTKMEGFKRVLIKLSRSPVFACRKLTKSGQLNIKLTRKCYISSIQL